MTISSWTSTPLSELAAIYDGTHMTPNYVAKGVPFYSVENVTRGNFDDTKFISEEVFDVERRRVQIDRGDILMTRIGDIGTCKLIDWDVRASFYVSLALIKPNGAVKPAFLLQYMRSSQFQKELHKRTIHVAFPKKINLGEIGLCTVPLPPVPVQDRIAEILETWDRAIETVEALIANARDQKAALMQALLTGRIRLPGFEGDWTWTTFSDVFERVRDKNTIGDTNVLTISAQHGLISQTEYFNKVVASDDVRGYTLLRRGDFAYNKSYSDGYPFGAFKPLDRYEQGIVSSLYICFRLAGAEHDHGFMRHYFEAGLFNREVAAIAQEGARNHGLLNVSVVDFFDTSLHAPPLDEQRAIAAVINDAEAKERALTVQRDALREEKAALMQQLLTGKRRVKVARGESE